MSKKLHILQYDETAEEMHSFIFDIDNIVTVECVYGVTISAQEPNQPVTDDKKTALEEDISSTRQVVVTVKGNEPITIEVDNTPTSFRVFELDYAGKGKEILVTKSVRKLEQYFLGYPT